MRQSLVMWSTALMCTLLCTLAPAAIRAQNAPAPAAVTQTVIVVVNSANPVTALSKQQVSDIFLKKITRWPSDQSIVPVDQERIAKPREIFTKIIHGRSVSAIATYWQTQIFSGNNVPPITKPSDADVLTYIRATPNAIGYVNSTTPLGTNLKAVTVNGL